MRTPRTAVSTDSPPSPLRAHLRSWGLLWAAVAVGLLLVGSTAWVRWGIATHADELAAIHGNYLLTKHSPSGSLEQQLVQLRPFGGWGLTRYDDAGMLQESVGEISEPTRRAPLGPVRTHHGRYLVEQPLRDGVLVIEYVPMLLFDLLGRATRGLALSVVASGLLVSFVAMWTRYRIRLEALTLEAERTRHLAQLGTLSAVIAHELRNPLTVLMGHVQLLREDLPESRSLEHVESGANRLEALLDSLLTFAKTGEVSREPTDPRALLERAALAVGLSSEVVSGHAPSWRLDAVRMQQVLQNLLDNAVTAAPDGRVSASVRADGLMLVYEVRDDGVGIPPGMHEQVFEPFHTGRTQGTGLGLAVARAIVEKHGGTLNAHDGSGGGALFRARIPA